MAYIQSHVPVQYTQPDTAGFYVPNQQQLCVTQQMQQIQQGTSIYSHMPQVQSQNIHTLNSTYMHPIVQQQYVTSFPPLTDTPSPWQKVEYKKRPTDSTEKLMQNVKRIKLNGSWLKQPSPSNNNRFQALSGEENVEGGGEAKRTTSKAPPVFVAGIENLKPLEELLVTVAGDDFELKALNSTHVKNPT